MVLAAPTLGSVISFSLASLASVRTTQLLAILQSLLSTLLTTFLTIIAKLIAIAVFKMIINSIPSLTINKTFSPSLGIYNNIDSKINNIPAPVYPPPVITIQHADTVIHPPPPRPLLYPPRPQLIRDRGFHPAPGSDDDGWFQNLLLLDVL